MSRVQSAAPRAAEKEKVAEQQILEIKIKSAFEVFDSNLNGTVDVREVGTILRSLGVYPTLEQLHTYMEEDEPSGYVTLKKFLLVSSQILTSKYPQKSDEETLFRAFSVLDTDKKGYFLPEDLKKYMSTMGEPLTNEEIDEMLAACTDPAEGKVFYEDYAQILSQ